MSRAKPKTYDELSVDSEGPIPRLPVPRFRDTPQQAAARARRAVAALERIAQRDGFRHIEDPAAWQREIREDRPLPGRDD